MNSETETTVLNLSKYTTEIPDKEKPLIHQDDEGSKMGMWLFLLTEVLLFGGMFIIYAAYRFIYADGFKAAALEMNTFIGFINTLILLTSSLTVALSIAALQRRKKSLTLFLLGTTLTFGLVFLINKYFEWKHEINKGIYPKGPALENMSQGEILYYGLYYSMTGLHGLHVIAGMIFISIIMIFIVRNNITPDNYVKLENSGLYWHLVDIIWIFLFPLFYLIH